MKKRIRIKAPASTSNLGSGYDVMGLALQLYNEVDLVWDSAESKNKFIIEGEGRDQLPHNEKNIIWKCMEKVWSLKKKPKGGIRVRMINRIPLARGLGSSAAARLSGVLAANALCGSFLNEKEIIQLVVSMEGHPDNVVPSFRGGLCVSALDGEQCHAVRLKVPKHLKAVVCVPEFELATDKARKAIPKKVSHQDAVFNISRASILLSALMTGDDAHIRLGMEDRLHQPYRKKLVPGFDAVIKNGYNSGALGVALSGAGPSIFAFATQKTARSVGHKMELGFARKGIASRSMILDFDNIGAKIQCH